MTMYKPISETHKDERLSNNTQENFCAQCKDCRYWNGGDYYSNRHDKSSCQKYMFPDCKPIGVINNQSRCEFYTEVKKNGRQQRRNDRTGHGR